MKRLLITLCFLYSFQSLTYAQSPTLQDFDKLLNFAQVTFPELLSPPTTTSQAEVLGSTWFYRDYGFLVPVQGGTGLALAVNVTGGSGFNSGDVFAIGGAFGVDPVFVDTLDNLLTLVPDSPGQGNESGIVEPGNGNCVPVRFPSTGTRATYEKQGAVYDQDLMLTGEFTLSEQVQMWVEVLSQQMTVRTEQMIAEEGYQQTTTNDMTQYWEFANDLRYQKRLESHLVTEISIPNLREEVQETDSVTIYDPPGMLEGPADQLCEGQVFYSAPVPGSLMTTIYINQALFSEVDSQTSSVAFTSEVNSIDTEISTPAGTFDTVKITTSNDAGASINWLDADTGLPVLTEGYDESGNLTSVSTLQAVSN